MSKTSWGGGGGGFIFLGGIAIKKTHTKFEDLIFKITILLLRYVVAELMTPLDVKI